MNYRSWLSQYHHGGHEANVTKKLFRNTINAWMTV